MILVGGVFVAYIGLGGPMQCNQTAAVVEVDGHAYFRDDFLRVQNERERALQQMAGDSFDPSTATDFLRAAAANTLVSRTILAGEARRLGLGVSKAELRDLVVSDTGFRNENGEFDKERYRQYVEYEYVTEARFLDVMETEMLAAKMVRLISSTAHVSEAEARAAALHRMEEIRTAFVVFDPALLEAEELSEEEVAAFVAAQPEAIQALYDERLSEYDQDEAVRARHILIRVPSSAEEAEVAAAEAKAQETLERIQEGADFVDVALEVSEDPGSKHQGGDLGFFTRGQMTPPFEEAAFAAEPGVLVGPVRSDFGFHLLRVEEHREARSQTLDEVRDDLARELLATERASSVGRDKAEALLTALRDGGSLESAARAQALTVERTGWLRRRSDGFVPGLGASVELLDTAFGQEPGKPSLRIFEVDGKLALIETLERRGPAEEQLAAAAAQEREQMLDRRRNQLVDDWIQTERSRLEAEGKILINLANAEY